MPTPPLVYDIGPDTIDRLSELSARVGAAVLPTLPVEPGDLTMTGTPPDVGLSSGVYLRPGDVIEWEVEGPGFAAADLPSTVSGG